ncbi:HNH endonuclease [Cellulomonas sp. URHD0024]|uniref:HNH endonuclease n=1 Tax=Cellulomonas sp. URHD0024 TaxID=1302620 RepID=UPI0009DC15DC|nr:HNH endonuclease [Cellulomonas sp. URHD0024]
MTTTLLHATSDAVGDVDAAGAVDAVDAAAVERWRSELAIGLDGLRRGALDEDVRVVPRPVPVGRDVRAEAAGASSQLVELITALEGLKSAACALQAEAAVAFERMERDRQAHEGVPSARRGLGVAPQVALARRESPHRGAALCGAAKVWLSEMPHTFGALRSGRLSEHRAMLLVQETACLDLEERREVDVLLCGQPSALDGVGTRRLVASARALVARLDPSAVVRRARRAESERCVTLRPAPDTMTYLTALLPVAQGVAAYAALCRAADAAVVSPDADALSAAAAAARAVAAGAVAGVAAGAVVGGAEAGSGAPVTSINARTQARRGRGQVMADTLVELVTGQSSASAVPVTVNLVLSDSALLGAGHEPGVLPGTGPVPAQIARELVAAGIDADAAWVRRLYADPHGDLVAMTSRARFHPDGLAEFLRIRDQGMCRTPYCGAPIRHIDHIVPAAAGGKTTAANGEGLCIACNLAKEAPGWIRRPIDRGGALSAHGASGSSVHRVVTTTPTGHQYVSHAPSMPVDRARPARSLGEMASVDEARSEGSVGVPSSVGGAAREVSVGVTSSVGGAEREGLVGVPSSVGGAERDSLVGATSSFDGARSDGSVGAASAAAVQRELSAIDVCFTALVAECPELAA